MFRKVLGRVGPLITKKDTQWRDVLEPGLKLAITLRHLATRDSYHSLCFSFQVTHNIISLIVRDFCEVIIEEYADKVVKLPATPDEWREVAEKFGSRWNFHHALGARCIVENSFGIIANRFQCLLITLWQEPETVGSIVLTCCCLHNLM